MCVLPPPETKLQGQGCVSASDCEPLRAGPHPPLPQSPHGAQRDSAHGPGVLGMGGQSQGSEHWWWGWGVTVRGQSAGGAGGARVSPLELAAPPRHHQMLDLPEGTPRSHNSQLPGHWTQGGARRVTGGLEQSAGAGREFQPQGQEMGPERPGAGARRADTDRSVQTVTVGGGKAKPNANMGVFPELTVSSTGHLLGTALQVGTRESKRQGFFAQAPRSGSPGFKSCLSGSCLCDLSQDPSHL